MEGLVFAAAALMIGARPCWPLTKQETPGAHTFIDRSFQFLTPTP